MRSVLADAGKHIPNLREIGDQLRIILGFDYLLFSKPLI
jgi:hypothetical protein